MILTLKCANASTVPKIMGLKTPVPKFTWTQTHPNIHSHSNVLPISCVWCWVAVCVVARSRLADFLNNCQPSPLTASGCLKDSAGLCLRAYAGLIGMECVWGGFVVELHKVEGCILPQDKSFPRNNVLAHCWMQCYPRKCFGKLNNGL